MTFTPSQNHWAVNGYRERVTKDELQELLLNKPNPIKHGRMREWKHEKVGPQVYEIWISEETTTTPTN